MKCIINKNKLKYIDETNNQYCDATGIEFSGCFGSEIADGYCFKMAISDEALAELILDGTVELTHSYHIGTGDAIKIAQKEKINYKKFVKEWVENKQKKKQKRYVLVVTSSGARWNPKVSYSRKTDAEKAKKRIIKNLLGVPWKNYLSVQLDN